MEARGEDMKIRGQTVYPLQERLSRLSVKKDNGCIEWIGALRNGYGRLMIGSRPFGRKSVSAHRLSYELNIGLIPENMYICHKCDNKKCINPDHLFLGAHQDNVNDREAKGRNNPLSGEAHASSKLNEASVLSAKRLRAKGLTYQAIADRFGVHKTTIMDAIKGKSWKDSPQPPVIIEKEGV